MNVFPQLTDTGELRQRSLRMVLNFYFNGQRLPQNHIDFQRFFYVDTLAHRTDAE